MVQWQHAERLSLKPTRRRRFNSCWGSCSPGECLTCQSRSSPRRALNAPADMASQTGARFLRHLGFWHVLQIRARRRFPRPTQRWFVIQDTNDQPDNAGRCRVAEIPQSRIVGWTSKMQSTTRPCRTAGSRSQFGPITSIVSAKGALLVGCTRNRLLPDAPLS